ncbi:MAG: hypothetical protein L0338_00135 [Acidobacteria bacterium]|nr:hypothetical protein [Acidobacteriota bacterium]
MAKLFVTGVVEWIIMQPDVIVSVESSTGKPVTGLTAKDFTVGVIGSGGTWNALPIFNTNLSASSRGLYGLFVKPPAPFSQWQSWMSDFVITVDVVSGK